MRALTFVLAFLAMVPAARAADLTVTVRDLVGSPVRDAVVMLRPSKATAGPIRFGWPYRMAQRDITFDPFVLIVPVGAQVTFPNFDAVRHHVYSFSKPKPFELKLYGKDETRSVVFDRPGVVAVGCNIHDRMAAYILVVDTPYAAKTDAAGVAVLKDAPGGPGALRVWHPYLKGPGNEITRAFGMPPGSHGEAFTVDVRAPGGARHRH